jgi:hypothetical protein
LEFASNVGDVLGVISTLGAVMMVSFVAEGGSAGPLTLIIVVAERMAGASSFILALVLVGGMYSSLVYKRSNKAERGRIWPVPSWFVRVKNGVFLWWGGC